MVCALAGRRLDANAGIVCRMKVKAAAFVAEKTFRRNKLHKKQTKT